MASENTIYFYPGRGGHSHDGENSSFIDTSKYSLFDFSWGIFGDPSRIADQTRNYVSFENFIIETVNNAVLKPANIILQPGTVNGTSHIVSRSIDTGLITANAITANEIRANTITSNELAANFVLVNTIITSGNFNGTFNANTFALSNVGTTGWAISSAGDAVFSAASIRGTLTAGALYINAYNQWYANGSIYVGNPQFDEPGFSYSVALGMSVRGSITATSGRIASFDIDGSTLFCGDQFIGWIQLGPVGNAGYGGADAGEIAVATRDPLDNHVVTATMRGDYFQVLDDDDNSRVSYMDKDGFTTNGIVACDSVHTPSVVYPYSANQIAFSWNGSVLSAVIDGTAYPLSTGGGAPATTSPATAPATTTSPATTTTTSPATTTTTSPGGGCVVCNTPGVADCCSPATCGSFKDGFICLTI